MLLLRLNNLRVCETQPCNVFIGNTLVEVVRGMSEVDNCSGYSRRKISWKVRSVTFHNGASVRRLWRSKTFFILWAACDYFWRFIFFIGTTQVTSSIVNDIIDFQYFGSRSFQGTSLGRVRYDPADKFIVHLLFLDFCDGRSRPFN